MSASPYADADDRVKVPVDLSRNLADDARVKARILNLTLSGYLESLLAEAITTPTRRRAPR